jgi:hypothetical protein
LIVTVKQFELEIRYVLNTVRKSLG